MYNEWYQPIPLFVLSTHHPRSRPLLSGPGGRRPPGKRPTSSRPRNWATAAGWWGVRTCALGIHSDQTGMVSPGDVHFSQDHCPPPHITHTLYMCIGCMYICLLFENFSRLRAFVEAKVVRIYHTVGLCIIHCLRMLLAW